MAEVKLSELDAVTEVPDNALVYVVIDGVSYRTTKEKLVENSTKLDRDGYEGTAQDIVDLIPSFEPGLNITIEDDVIDVDIPDFLNVSTVLGITGIAPQSSVFDQAGNLYVANYSSNNISKITPAGVSSIFATTEFFPSGICIDVFGNLYTSNNGSYNVSKITPAGVSSVFATTGIYPNDITIDENGNLYVTNGGSNNVSKITPAGVSSIFATTGDSPRCIKFGTDGNLYVTNGGSNNVSKITPAGVSSIFASVGSFPWDFTIDDNGNLYVANYSSNNISKITPAGVSSIFATTESLASGIAIDDEQNIYVSNRNINSISKITPLGISSIFANTGTHPTKIKVDISGNIYTLNSSSNNVTKITVDTARSLSVNDAGKIIRVPSPYTKSESDAKYTAVITTLRDGVATEGNTLQKLFNLISGAGAGVSINDLTPSLTETYSSQKSVDTFVAKEAGKSLVTDAEKSNWNAASIGSDLGLLKTTDTPPPTGTHKGDVATAGTYTNFKNAGVALVFTAPELADNYGYIYVVNNVATKSLVAKKGAKLPESFNLIPNYNNGLSNLKKGGYLAGGDSDYNTFYSMNGASAGSSVAIYSGEFAGFKNTIKASILANETFRYFAQSIDVTKSIATPTSKLVLGCFVKVPSGYTGTISLFIGNNKANWGGVVAGTTTEFVEYANGWRYYRTDATAVIGSATNFILQLKVDNVADAEIYIAQPSIVISENKLSPNTYVGKDALQENVVTKEFLTDKDFQRNIASNALLINDNFKSDPSILSSSWFLVSNNFATYGVVDSISPVSNRAIEVSSLKRSSDSTLSLISLRNVGVIDLNLVNRGVNHSVGFWLKRESLVDVTIQCVYWGKAKNYLGIKSATLNPFTETFGNWVFVTASNIVPFANSYFMGVDIKFTLTGTPVLDQIYKAYVTGLMLNPANPILSGFIPNPYERVTNVTGRVGIEGRKWVSYGDSITQRAEWQRFVVNRLNLKHTNLGIGGTSVTNVVSQTSYVNMDGTFLSYTLPTTGTEGVNWVKLTTDFMANQDRINTIPLDTEVITIMGGTNDLGKVGFTMGTISDSSLSTFYGAYQTMLDRIQIRIPNAEILLSTILFRTNEGTAFPDGLYAEDARTAIFAIGKKYGYKVVDLKSIGINQSNQSTYLSDGIHPNAKGGERMARAFAEKMAQLF